ncbi:MAG: cupin domain-containing protein [Xanthomonadales bacterium]|nr:cupin domain-containing protein [Xanthomonadales bacterium]
MSIEDLVFFDRHEAEFDESVTDPEKCVRGQPVQRTWNHFTSTDGKLFAGIWEVEPGCWRVRYSENEYCHILAGKSVLRDQDGGARTVQAGDQFVIPAGFEGEWEALEATRKVYVIYQP